MKNGVFTVGLTAVFNSSNAGAKLSQKRYTAARSSNVIDNQDILNNLMVRNRTAIALKYFPKQQDVFL